MAPFPVVFDANVLYGTYVNDLLLRLADRGLFRPLWSERILDELENALLRDALPDKRGALRRRVEAMRTAFPDALVEGYEDLEAAMTCDPKDRHVLAAAVRSNAALLVTFNLKDFPSDSLTPYGIEVAHPDVFLMDQLDLRPGRTVGAVEEILTDYTNPPLDVPAYLHRLRRSGVPDFARVLGRHLE